ncbi:MAG: formylglycine-generating enzyme family protein [Saprospiraceae bacterium]|nr:formylglycine-generating enzyme family protein [Saprospiraceae bacterium]
MNTTTKYQVMSSTSKHTEIENSKLSFETRKVLSEEVALEGDTRINCFNPTMINIQGGKFIMGTDMKTIFETVDEFQYVLNKFTKEECVDWFSKSYPPHQVSVNSFRVSKYLVTNSQFNQFYTDKFGSTYDSDIVKSNHPVKNIQVELAKEYCYWLNEKTEKKFRLLTEEEWEWAATNGGKTRFPWGNEKVGLLANTAEANINDTTAVGLFPDGFSESGIADLGGNVEEWVDTLYKPYPGGKIVTDRIYQFGKTDYNVLRGGCYSLHLDLCLGYRRHGYFPDYSVTGFRICESI